MKSNFKKLISYYKPYKTVFFFDLLFSFISAASVLIIPFVVRYLTDNLISMRKSEAFKIMFICGIIIVSMLILKLGCDFFTLYYGHMMGARIESDMRLEIFEHYQELSLDFFDKRKTGDLLSRVTLDLNNISEILHHTPEDFLQIVIRIGGVITMFFLLNVRAALVLLIILTIMGVFGSFFIKKMHKAFVKNHEEIASVNSQIEDSISGVRVVKTFANEDIEIEKFKEKNSHFVTSQKKCFKIMSVSNSGLMFFITAILPVIAVSGLVLLFNNEITYGTLVTFLLAESIIIGPIFSIINQIEAIQNTAAGYKRFLEVLNTQPMIVDSLNAKSLKNVQGKIKFKDVSFCYGSGKNIFSNLNLEIKPGEYVALVGASGAGKSTLCNLIPRLYDVSSGQILIDDTNVKNIKSKNLRKNIGFVQQDTFLFSGTIFENIRYGQPKASKEEIINAAKSAHAHEFIMNLPQGYHTKVGQRGVKLSGGQKQRIAIARVFVKNPPILIFDEATSSLDNESEKHIQKSMENLAKNRTTIVIAHRLSTIINAKRIIVLSDGKITEEGTHNELIEKNGVYSGFFQKICI